MPEAVISNTSPLQYLYQLGQLTLLRHFYQQVTVPPAVVQELAAGAARGVACPYWQRWPGSRCGRRARAWCGGSRVPWGQANAKPWRWRWRRPTPCSS